MRHTTRDGLSLHVEVDGPAEAELTAVLCHCWTSDHRSWRYQVRDLRRAFGERVRVITYDHRGHGESDRTSRDTATIDNLARDLAGILDEHAPTGPLFLAGHSIGGMTLMALAEQRPKLFAERVRGVLFVATSGGSLGELPRALPTRAGERVKDRIPAMLALRARMVSRRRRRNAPAIESLVVRRFLFGRPSRLTDHALTVEALINTPPESMCGFFEDLMRHDRVEGLSVLADLPVHVLVGDRDRLTPPSHARLLARKIPGAGLTVVPGAGHMLPLEREELVSRTLVAMLEPVLGTSAREQARAHSVVPPGRSGQLSPASPASADPTLSAPA